MYALLSAARSSEYCLDSKARQLSKQLRSISQRRACDAIGTDSTRAALAITEKMANSVGSFCIDAAHICKYKRLYNLRYKALRTRLRDAESEDGPNGHVALTVGCCNARFLRSSCFGVGARRDGARLGGNWLRRRGSRGDGEALARGFARSWPRVAACPRLLLPVSPGVVGAPSPGCSVASSGAPL